MPIDFPETVYCTRADIQAVLSVDGEISRADDDSTGSLSSVEVEYINKAIAWATAKINFYCSSRYCPDELARSWLVNEWAVILACKYLSRRRTNPIPASIHEAAKEVIEDLKLVHSGQYEIPQTPTREAAMPAWSNVRIDIGMALRKIRVQRQISEDSPTPYRQHRDWPSDFIVER